MMVSQLYWLILGIMVVAAYGLGRVSIRRQVGVKEKEIGWRPRNEAKSIWWSNWLQGVSTELVGAVVTTILLVIIVGGVERSIERARYKAELIAQMGSPSNTTALEAVRKLSAEGWLRDGSLHEGNFGRANLENADLSRADLYDAWFVEANLRNVIFDEANLEHVVFQGADLRGARMYKANLFACTFVNANMEGVFLGYSQLQVRFEGTNLRGANLSHSDFEGSLVLAADLRGANLEGAINLPDEMLATSYAMRGATMPDGTLYDGRFRLSGDLSQAEDEGVDTSSEQEMADYYGVSIEEYKQGQAWTTE
jgi:hypothetical protein